MKRGTIILTLFPFTDLSTAKRRPAVVVSKNKVNKDEVIVAFISSVIPDTLSETDLFFDNQRDDYRNSGLKKESVFKLDKLATLSKSIFSGELGFVDNLTIAAINEKLRLALDLK